MSTIMTIGKRKPDPALVLKDTVPERRIPFVAYVKVKNPDQLGLATHLDNREFYYVDLNDKHDKTEMMVVDISAMKYQLVTRTLNDDNFSYTDITTDINTEMYVSLRNLSDLGYKYKYLEFPIPDTPDFWTCMVMMSNNGTDHPWIRVEASLQDDEVVPQLPFEIEAYILENDENFDEEKRDFIANLWQNEYFKIDKRDIVKI